jgi:NAD(P)-dependent dehydrogenase (short-subunit alcohol dehydrogenase family)
LAQNIEVLTVVNDLGDASANPAESLVSAVLDRYGKIDILVNNAGTVWGATAERHSPEAWRKVMGLNIDACFFVAREMAQRSMIPSKSGKIITGGGATEWLPDLMGRARALEVIVGSDDFDAETAERYGWINRCLPDAELDTFVDRFALRIASFDGQAVAEAKRLVNRHTLPSGQDFLESQSAFLGAARWPQLIPRILRARKRAAAVGADFELRLGHHPADI